VDLIYLNATRQNIVMLQYKMLEPLRAGGDRIRPRPQPANIRCATDLP